MPGAYVVPAAVFGLLPWLLARASSRPLIVALLAAVLLDAAGLAPRWASTGAAAGRAGPRPQRQGSSGRC